MSGRTSFGRASTVRRCEKRVRKLGSIKRSFSLRLHLPSACATYLPLIHGDLGEGPAVNQNELDTLTERGFLRMGFASNAPPRTAARRPNDVANDTGGTTPIGVTIMVLSSRETEDSAGADERQSRAQRRSASFGACGLTGVLTPRCLLPGAAVRVHEFATAFQLLHPHRLGSVGLRKTNRFGRGQDLSPVCFALQTLGHIDRVTDHCVV